ncbi:patatin-like phospholipase family protein [Paraburkholderia sp. LEh10]|uniref:patatin-like phospholipase family protein n=1 Tax=Paraburkholderia sp. LEh10 TaxID=2821353 RepID=UPI001AE31720|nr:patatin-like phospholipase family protein [Paraburkholderia sp. LEh10]MBP0590023.1 patatin-like phospholipase family protein [Paraburkholderia sp. LEh10]
MAKKPPAHTAAQPSAQASRASAPAREAHEASAHPAIDAQVVLVLQGGGALGAYQAGVFEALHDAGIEPDWVIGTSIGAINGAVIAGNRPEDRMQRLHAFWDRVTWQANQTPDWLAACAPACAALGIPNWWAAAWAAWMPGYEPWLRNLSIMSQGIPTFFTPRAGAWLGAHVPVGIEQAAFYHTEPLRETLTALIDFDYLNRKQTRLTVGTVGVGSGQMRYFTNRDQPLDVQHVMASAAFPPGFPSVRIDGEAYWDGGIYSNTPLEAVLDDRPRHSSVIFTVQLWPAHGAEPASIREAMSRQRDIQYSSRAESHLERQRQIHRLRHVIRELGTHLPEDERESAAVKELLNWGCGTTMQVIELDAPSFDRDELHKDIDFSADGIRRRWQAGYADAQRMIARAPWREEPDPMEGIAIHRSDPEAA